MNVSIQKIAKYAKHFDVVIVYESTITIPFSEIAKSLFQSVKFITDENLAQSVPIQCHLLLICGSYSFLKSSELRGALVNAQTLETLILTQETANINVYKLALFLRAFSVVAAPSDDEEFANALMGVFSSLIKKHNESVLVAYERTISEFSDNLYWIHKQGKTVYANDALKRTFNIKTLNDIDQQLKNHEIALLMQSSGTSQKIIKKADSRGEERDYFIRHQPLKDGEYLISMIPLLGSLDTTKKQLHNRMNFIELLKDAFVIHKRENEPIPLIVMYIENADKIIEMRGEDLYNDVCKEILKHIELTFDSDIEIAQWHKDIFTLLASSVSFGTLKKNLETFHQRLEIEISVEGVHPVINSFIVDMHGVELNRAIGIIDHINQKQLFSRDLSHLIHFEISATEHEIDDHQQAAHYLEKMILTNTSVKLLNFYKGIRISTVGKLIKISDDMVYISIEKIQGYAMKLEQSVVIQGPNVPFDILANVKIVDVAKKIAVLSKFEPLQSSGNNRQYIRIQSDHRMHVTISSGKSVISGTILDISIKSIACKLSVSKVALRMHSSVNLQFNLPMERADEGMVSMSIAGKVQYIQEGDDFTKVVIELNLVEPYESYLIEYIYARQQALVNEIRMIANKL
jgi:GGDEF domain-containing protein